MIREKEEAREGRAGSLVGPLGLAFWRMKRAYERELGVGLGMWFALDLIAGEGGISQGELWREFELDPSRITRLAQRLEREGWIRRERDPDDSRVVRLYATPKGQKVVEELRRKHQSVERRIAGSLDPQEAGELRKTLEKLAEATKD